MTLLDKEIMSHCAHHSGVRMIKREVALLQQFLFFTHSSLFVAFLRVVQN